MDKSTQKRNIYNKQVLESLANRYGVSVTYVRKCVREKNISPTADTIRKDYFIKVSEIKKVLEK